MSKDNTPREINRYEIDGGWDGWRADKDPDGDWVKYDDHKKHAQELKEGFQKENEKLQKEVERLEEERKDLAKRAESLRFSSNGTEMIRFCTYVDELLNLTQTDKP